MAESMVSETTAAVRPLREISTYAADCNIHTPSTPQQNGILTPHTSTSHTPVTSPPPHRKFATISRWSSFDVLVCEPPTASSGKSAGNTPESHRKIQQQTLAVNTGAMRHSVSQPNGFYDWQKIQKLSPIHLHKTTKLAFRRKSKQMSEQPLHYPKNSETLIRYMESQRDDVIDLNALNHDGDGPIHAIVRRKRKRRADLLLTLLVHGCSQVDINKYSEKSGDTALHLATMEADEVLVKTLLIFGADVNLVNNACQTPLDIAIDMQNSTIVAILVSVGGMTGDCVLDNKDYTASICKLEPFDKPTDIDNDTVDAASMVNSSAEEGDLPNTPSSSVRGDDGCPSEPCVCREGERCSSADEMVFSGGAWREAVLKDFDKGTMSSTLFEKLNEYINSNLTFSESVSVCNSVDEAVALMKQQRELLRYKKTERLQSSFTRPRAGSRVLCLDGGGVRGLIQIEVLRQMELQTGIKVTDIFDWIVGTSTGGILALVLVYAKKSISELRQLYFKLKNLVFSSGRLGIAYNTEALEKVLKEVFGTNITMADCRHPKVLITAVYKKTNYPELHLFNNCFDNEFSKQLVWKVARYTSAAPLFFSEMDNYVDGGVLANNPCEYALTAINNFYRGNRGQVAGISNPMTTTADQHKSNVALVVSIGTGIFPAEELGNTDAHQFLFFGKHWFKPKAGPFQVVENLITLLTKALMESEAVAENCQSRLQLQGIPFYRFNPQLKEAIPSPEINGEKLLNMIMETRYQTMGVLMEQLVTRLHDIQAIMKRQSVHKKIALVCKK